MVLLFTGCTTARYQQLHAEREEHREAFEAARRQDTAEQRRHVLSDDMLGRWRFLELVVEKRGGGEAILQAKAERVARRLEGFTVRFWQSGNATYSYRIENLLTHSHGRYTTRGLHNSDKPNSAGVRFYPIAGTEIPDLLFGFAAGLEKQVLLSMGSTTEVHSIKIGTGPVEISMEENQMSLVLDLGMVLGPDGWFHQGNIRCSFFRIE